MNILSDAVLDSVSSKLEELNTESVTNKVLGFWLDDGEASGEVYANVVFLIKALKKDADSYSASNVDSACAMAAQRLQGVVTHTYCWFRAPKEFEKDFPDAVNLRVAS